MVLELSNDVYNVSLPLSESTRSWFCFEVVHVNIVRRDLVENLLVLEIVYYDIMMS